MSPHTPVARGALVLLLSAPALGACSNDDDAGKALPTSPTLAPEGEPFESLAEWGLFDDLPSRTPDEELLPFDVISVLYADDASKTRQLWLPPGTSIGYHPTDPWTFPVGTIIAKTFWFPLDARDPSGPVHTVETRLLVHESTGWVGHLYLWNEEQTGARYAPAGSTQTVSWTTETGEARDQQYNVPNVGQCQDCHGIAPATRPLGPRTRQLDRSFEYPAGAQNQLAALRARGWLDGDGTDTHPTLVDPYADGDVTERARSWLDANCSHCHSETGQARSTGFHVDYPSTDPVTGDPSSWGVCKFPTSAGQASGGLTYDVVPGSPSESILILRVGSTEGSVKMPPLLTRRVDERALTLLSDWIAAMPPVTCTP